MPPSGESSTPLHVILDTRFMALFDEPISDRRNQQRLENALIPRVDRPTGIREMAASLQNPKENSAQEQLTRDRQNALGIFIDAYTGLPYESRNTAVQEFISERGNGDTIYATDDQLGYLRQVARVRGLAGTPEVLEFYRQKALGQLGKLCSRARHGAGLPFDAALSPSKIRQYLASNPTSQFGYIAHALLSFSTVAGLIEDSPQEFWNGVFARPGGPRNSV